MTRAQWLAKRRTGKPRGWLNDAAARSERARKAGRAARVTHLKKACERAKAMPGNEAWMAGYKVGYQRAYHRWHLWAKRYVRQVTGRAA